MYKLTLNKTQLSLLNRAIHAYMRLMAGQLGMAVEDLHYADQYNNLNKVQQALIKQLQHDYNYNQMVSPRPKETDILYDMYQVLRHQLWKELPEPPKGVVSEYVTKMSKEPLIKIENIDETSDLNKISKEAMDLAEQEAKKYKEDMQKFGRTQNGFNDE